MIPTLTTARLTLRAPQMADFPAYSAFLASPRSKGVDGPLNTKAAWAYFTHDCALWHLAGHGSLMIVRRDTGALAGSISLNAGPMFDEVELGWMVYDGHTNMGLCHRSRRRLARLGLGHAVPADTGQLCRHRQRPLAPGCRKAGGGD